MRCRRTCLISANLERMSPARMPASIAYWPAATCPLSVSMEDFGIPQPIVLRYWLPGSRMFDQRGSRASSASERDTRFELSDGRHLDAYKHWWTRATVARLDQAP